MNSVWDQNSCHQDLYIKGQKHLKALYFAACSNDKVRALPTSCNLKGAKGLFSATPSYFETNAYRLWDICDLMLASSSIRSWEVYSRTKICLSGAHSWSVSLQDQRLSGAMTRSIAYYIEEASIHVTMIAASMVGPDASSILCSSQLFRWVSHGELFWNCHSVQPERQHILKQHWASLKRIVAPIQYLSYRYQ